MTPLLLFQFPMVSDLGSSLRQTLALLSNLTERGYTIFGITSNRHVVSEFKARQWHVQSLWTGTHTTSIFLAVLLLPFLLLWHRVRYHTRIVLCLTLTDKLIGTLFGWLLGMRVLWIEYSLPTRALRVLPHRLLYILLARCATVVTVSEVARKAFHHLGVPTSHCVHIYPGVPDGAGWQTSIFGTIAETRQPVYRRGQFYIGTIARLTEEKGIEYLLQAVRRCKDVIPGIQCIIVGHGPERQALQWLTERLDIKQHVLFVGWQAAAQKWMMHFDVFVAPTVHVEAFHNAIVEAMAEGKPVIGTRIGAIPEIIESTKTGMLVDPRNPEMLAEALLNLYHHPEWREEMGNRGRKRVATLFSITRMADEFEKLLL